MDRLRLWLHGLLSTLKTSPQFTQLALKLWPTRKIAQRQASELFDVVNGFVYSQILFTAVQLKLLEFLKKPNSISEISRFTGLTQYSAHRLLKSTTAIKLTHALPGNHYGLGRLGTAVISNPGLVELIQHHQMFYRDLADPLKLFETPGTTQLGQYWAYAKTTDPSIADKSNTDEVRAYSELMAASQPMVSNQVLASYPFEKHQKLLDLGGGTGQFLISLSQRHTTLALEAFDLPAVTSIIDKPAMLSKHIEITSGDFFQDSLPTGADIVSLIRILHDHNDDAVEVLLTKVFNALPDNGTILIAEPLSDTPGATRVGDAYFNLYFLAMGKGEPRSEKRLRQMLNQAGFTNIHQHATTLPLVCSVLSAQAKKPK